MKIYKSVAGAVLIMSTDSPPNCPRIVVEDSRTSLRDDYNGKLVTKKSLISRLTKMI